MEGGKALYDLVIETFKEQSYFAGIRVALLLLDLVALEPSLAIAIEAREPG